MVLHGPPKTWKRTAGNGKKRYNLTVYRNWKKGVQWVALQNKVKSWGKDGVRLTIRVNLINRQHMGDVDNYAKGIQDALEGFCMITTNRCIDSLWSVHPEHRYTAPRCMPRESPMIQSGDGKLGEHRALMLLGDGTILKGQSALDALRQGVQGNMVVLRTMEDVDELVEVVLVRCPSLELSDVRCLPWHSSAHLDENLTRLMHLVDEVKGSKKTVTMLDTDRPF